jgi:hypothetical protein
MQRNFAFRVKMGEYELEINGSHEEVMKTIEQLPSLITNVHQAFETVKPKTVATLTVKTGTVKGVTREQKYPKILPTENVEEAIIKILETDWGKWRPRTIEELKDALQSNGLNCSGKTLAGVLMGIVKKGIIRRWNTPAGFVYILGEKEALNQEEKNIGES